MIAIIAKKLARGKREEEEEVGLKSFHSNVARWRDEGRKEGRRDIFHNNPLDVEG